MVGSAYWFTGVTVKHSDGKWTAALDFCDNGFCDDASTEGRLTTRYYVATMAQAIDTLLADAERLGIVANSLVPGCPTIYVPGDGEGADAVHLPRDWRAQVRAECERRGWRCMYAESRDAATHEQ